MSHRSFFVCLFEYIVEHYLEKYYCFPLFF